MCEMWSAGWIGPTDRPHVPDPAYRAGLGMPWHSCVCCAACNCMLAAVLYASTQALHIAGGAWLRTTRSTAGPVWGARCMWHPHQTSLLHRFWHGQLACLQARSGLAPFSSCQTDFTHHMLSQNKSWMIFITLSLYCEQARCVSKSREKWVLSLDLA